MDGDSLEKIGRDYAINFGRLDAMNEAEREAFEKWADENQFCIHRDDTDKYREYHRATTRFAWQAWCARARTTARPPAPPGRGFDEWWAENGQALLGFAPSNLAFHVWKCARALSDTARTPQPDPERMEDALHKIKQWADAYPPDIFHIPTDDEWKRLHEAAQAAGLNGIDAFSAANMRHVITKVQEIADAALAQPKWIGSIPAEESDEEFARQIAEMDRPCSWYGTESNAQAAQPVAYRAMTRSWGTVQDEEWVYGPWMDGLGPRFEPLYTEESIPVVGRYRVEGGRVVEWEIDNAADERADGTYALLSPIAASGNEANSRSDVKEESAGESALLREALEEAIDQTIHGDGLDESTIGPAHWLHQARRALGELK